jgi:hypothetical protein
VCFLIIYVVWFTNLLERIWVLSLLKKKRKTQRSAFNNDEVRSRVRGHFESRGAFFFVVAFPLPIVNNNNLLFTLRTRYGFRNEKSEESTA